MGTDLMGNEGRKALVAALVIFLGTFALFAGVIRVGTSGDRPPFDIDEAHKLGETYFWHLLFEKNGIGQPAWNDDFYARTNPPVGKYIFGAALGLTGQHTESLQMQNDFERLWRDPQALRRLVPDRKLIVTRMTSALFGALAAAFLFLIGFSSAGWVAGFLVPLLFFAHPAMWFSVSLGLYDSICLAFTTLLIVISFKAGSTVARFCSGTDRRPARLLLFSVFIPALMISLAVGTKLNALVVLPAYAGFIALALYGTTSSGRRLRDALVATAVVLATSIASWFLFIAMNPRYYQGPIGKFLDMLRVSQDWTIKQQIEPGGGLFTLSEKLTAVGLYTLKSGWLPIHGWFAVLCFLVGLAALVLRSHCLRAYRADARAGPDRTKVDAVLVWVVVCLTGTIVWIPLAWTRYFMIPYAAVCVASAVGIGTVATFLLQRGPQLVEKLSGRNLPAGHSLRLPSPIYLGAAFLTTLVWLLLVFTPWILNPALLNPSYASVVLAPTDQEWQARSVLLSGSDHYLVDYYKAILEQPRDPARARKLLERSLDGLIRSGRHDLDTSVQRSWILYRLALVSAVQGDKGAAIGFLQSHMAEVERVKQMRISADPKVDEEYRQIVAERKRDLECLQEK
jgi:hypothetical protein